MMKTIHLFKLEETLPTSKHKYSYPDNSCMHVATTYISVDKLGEIGVPDVIHMGPLEEGHTSLIGLVDDVMAIVMYRRSMRVMM